MIIDKLFTLQAKKPAKGRSASGGKKKSGKKKKVILKYLLFLLALGLFLPAVSYILYQVLYWDRIYPFVRIAGLDLSGRKVREAQAFLENFTQRRKPTKLTLVFEDKIWVLDLESLDLVYFLSPTAEKAFYIGRNKNPLTALAEQGLAFWQKTNLDFEFLVNSDLLSSQVATLAAQIDLPPIPPSLEVLDSPDKETGERILAKSGEPGRILDQDKLKKDILKKLGQLEGGEITLSVEQVLPVITPKMIQDTKGRAGSLLGKKIILEFNRGSWQIEEKELVNLLSFFGGWEEAKIATYATHLAQSIDRLPQNALFRFQEGRVLEFKPAQEGQKLDTEKTGELIKDALQGLEGEEKNDILPAPSDGAVRPSSVVRRQPDQQNQTARVRLPVLTSKPEVTTEEVNNLGIKELIGEGQSWFYGSIQARIHNIKFAAGKLNGLIIAPGETFSLNKAIGDVSEATGFMQAYIIQKGRTVLGDGGGVCQVSTTVFRAVLNAGLPVEERQPHAYRVSYYEYNSGPGFDATVFYPTADLKFKNDTPAHILIQSFTDITKAKLTIQFYGTADGRQVVISQPRIWDTIAPPPDLYQDDPTLPVGVTKQIDWKAWGAKVSFDWKVTRGDEVLQDKTFYSHYRPWQAVFLRGTKE